jgi:hypothetical protein
MAIPGEPGQPMQIIQLPMPPPQSLPMQQPVESKPAARQEAVIDPSLQSPQPSARIRPSAKTKAKKEKEAKSAAAAAPVPFKSEPVSDDSPANGQEQPATAST